MKLPALETVYFITSKKEKVPQKHPRLNNNNKISIEYELAVSDYSGYILSIFAKNCQVTFQVGENVTLKRILSNQFLTENKSDKSVDLFIGDISLDEVTRKFSENSKKNT